jgi:hypothetical protein
VSYFAFPLQILFRILKTYPESSLLGGSEHKFLIFFWDCSEPRKPVRKIATLLHKEKKV